MRYWLLFTLSAVFLLAACTAATPTEPTATPARPNPPTPAFGDFDPATVADIDLADYPIVPVVNPAMKIVYAAGQAQGLNARVFAKLGDCMTENPYFLVTFAKKQYDLGEYQHLQAVLDHFDVPAHPADSAAQNSFGTLSLAAASGFNIAGPLDPTWANPQWCQSGESPLACEYRMGQPGFAIIMFGTNDVAFTDAATYNYFLRTLVQETLDQNIIPLLNTFPTRPENPENSVLFNKIVVKVAEDYAVPLINLNRALEPLPHHGVDPDDTIHLAVPPDQGVDHFTSENLQYGFTVRNLVTLQALEAVLAAVK